MNVEVHEMKRVKLASLVEMIGGTIIFTQNISGEWSAELLDCRGEHLLIWKPHLPGPPTFCRSRYTASHGQALRELAEKLTDSDPMMVGTPSRGWRDIFRATWFDLDLRHTIVVADEAEPSSRVGLRRVK